VQERMSDVADTEAWLVLVWSLVLLVSGLALNIAAVVLLLRSAGNCHRDSSVPALLSLLASNILHCLLVQVFSVHQQVTGSFLFTEKLCTVIQTNHGILSDVGFPTCCLQLVMTLRGLRKLRVTHTASCAALPWRLSPCPGWSPPPFTPSLLQGRRLHMATVVWCTGPPSSSSPSATPSPSPSPPSSSSSPPSPPSPHSAPASLHSPASPGPYRGVTVGIS